MGYGRDLLFLWRFSSTLGCFKALVEQNAFIKQTERMMVWMRGGFTVNKSLAVVKPPTPGEFYVIRKPLIF